MFCAELRMNREKIKNLFAQSLWACMMIEYASDTWEISILRIASMGNKKGPRTVLYAKRCSPCIHCNCTHASKRRRGLCMKCYVDPIISRQYEGQCNQYGGKNKKGEVEPTLEELEQMIQEQIPTMPRSRMIDNQDRLNSRWRPPRVKILGSSVHIKYKHVLYWLLMYLPTK